MAGGDEQDLIEAVVTCEGNLHDPDFQDRFNTLVHNLKSALYISKTKDPFRVRKIEPWNSVRVTISIPKEAAQKLKLLAQQGSNVLRSMGILSVQVEGDQVISLTWAAQNNEATQVILRQTSDEPAGSSGTSGVSSSSLPASSPSLSSISSSVASISSPVPLTPGSSGDGGGSASSTGNGGSGGMSVTLDMLSSSSSPTLSFRSPNVVAPSGEAIPVLPPKMPATGSRPALGGPFPFVSMAHAAQAIQRSELSPMLNSNNIASNSSSSSGSNAANSTNSIASSILSTSSSLQQGTNKSVQAQAPHHPPSQTHHPHLGNVPMSASTHNSNNNTDSLSGSTLTPARNNNILMSTVNVSSESQVTRLIIENTTTTPSNVLNPATVVDTVAGNNVASLGINSNSNLNLNNNLVRSQAGPSQSLQLQLVNVPPPYPGVNTSSSSNFSFISASSSNVHQSCNQASSNVNVGPSPLMPAGTMSGAAQIQTATTSQQKQQQNQQALLRKGSGGVGGAGFVSEVPSVAPLPPNLSDSTSSSGVLLAQPVSSPLLVNLLQHNDGSPVSDSPNNQNQSQNVSSPPVSVEQQQQQARYPPLLQLGQQQTKKTKRGVSLDGASSVPKHVPKMETSSPSVNPVATHAAQQSSSTESIQFSMPLPSQSSSAPPEQNLVTMSRVSIPVVPPPPLNKQAATATPTPEQSLIHGRTIVQGNIRIVDQGSGQIRTIPLQKPQPQQPPPYPQTAASMPPRKTNVATVNELMMKGSHEQMSPLANGPTTFAPTLLPTPNKTGEGKNQATVTLVQSVEQQQQHTGTVEPDANRASPAADQSRTLLPITTVNIVSKSPAKSSSSNVIGNVKDSESTTFIPPPDPRLSSQIHKLSHHSISGGSQSHSISAKNSSSPNLVVQTPSYNSDAKSSTSQLAGRNALANKRTVNKFPAGHHHHQIAPPPTGKPRQFLINPLTGHLEPMPTNESSSESEEGDTEGSTEGGEGRKSNPLKSSVYKNKVSRGANLQQLHHRPLVTTEAGVTVARVIKAPSSASSSSGDLAAAQSIGNAGDSSSPSLHMTYSSVMSVSKKVRSSVEDPNNTVAALQFQKESKDNNNPSPATVTATSVTGEKIKLRLKLEKNEPISPAYKVDVSFVKKPEKTSMLPCSSAHTTGSSSGSISSGGREATSSGNQSSPGDQPRVPPLHISLRGKNAAVVVSPRREEKDMPPPSSHSNSKESVLIIGSKDISQEGSQGASHSKSSSYLNSHEGKSKSGSGSMKRTKNRVKSFDGKTISEKSGGRTDKIKISRPKLSKEVSTDRKDSSTFNQIDEGRDAVHFTMPVLLPAVTVQKPEKQGAMKTTPVVMTEKDVPVKKPAPLQAIMATEKQKVDDLTIPTKTKSIVPTSSPNKVMKCLTPTPSSSNSARDRDRKLNAEEKSGPKVEEKGKPVEVNTTVATKSVTEPSSNPTTETPRNNFPNHGPLLTPAPLIKANADVRKDPVPTVVATTSITCPSQTNHEVDQLPEPQLKEKVNLGALSKRESSSWTDTPPSLPSVGLGGVGVVQVANEAKEESRLVQANTQKSTEGSPNSENSVQETISTIPTQSVPPKTPNSPTPTAKTVTSAPPPILPPSVPDPTPEPSPTQIQSGTGTGESFVSKPVINLSTDSCDIKPGSERQTISLANKEYTGSENKSTFCQENSEQERPTKSKTDDSSLGAGATDTPMEIPKERKVQEEVIAGGESKVVPESKECTEVKTVEEERMDISISSEQAVVTVGNENIQNTEITTVEMDTTENVSETKDKNIKEEFDPSIQSLSAPEDGTSASETSTTVLMGKMKPVHVGAEVEDGDPAKTGESAQINSQNPTVESIVKEVIPVPTESQSQSQADPIVVKSVTSSAVAPNCEKVSEIKEVEVKVSKETEVKVLPDMEGKSLATSLKVEEDTQTIPRPVLMVEKGSLPVKKVEKEELPTDTSVEQPKDNSSNDSEPIETSVVQNIPEVIRELTQTQTQDSNSCVWKEIVSRISSPVGVVEAKIEAKEKTKVDDVASADVEKEAISKSEPEKVEDTQIENKTKATVTQNVTLTSEKLDKSLETTYGTGESKMESVLTVDKIKKVEEPTNVVASAEEVKLEQDKPKDKNPSTVKIDLIPEVLKLEVKAEARPSSSESKSKEDNKSSDHSVRSPSSENKLVKIDSKEAPKEIAKKTKGTEKLVKVQTPSSSATIAATEPKTESVPISNTPKVEEVIVLATKSKPDFAEVNSQLQSEKAKKEIAQPEKPKVEPALKPEVTQAKPVVEEVKKEKVTETTFLPNPLAKKTPTSVVSKGCSASTSTSIPKKKEAEVVKLVNVEPHSEKQEQIESKAKTSSRPLGGNPAPLKTLPVSESTPAVIVPKLDLKVNTVATESHQPQPRIEKVEKVLIMENNEESESSSSSCSSSSKSEALPGQIAPVIMTPKNVDLPVAATPTNNPPISIVLPSNNLDKTGLPKNAYKRRAEIKPGALQNALKRLHDNLPKVLKTGENQDPITQSSAMLAAAAANSSDADSEPEVVQRPKKSESSGAAPATVKNSQVVKTSNQIPPSGVQASATATSTISSTNVNATATAIQPQQHVNMAVTQVRPMPNIMQRPKATISTPVHTVAPALHQLPGGLQQNVLTTVSSAGISTVQSISMSANTPGSQSQTVFAIHPNVSIPANFAQLQQSNMVLPGGHKMVPIKLVTLPKQSSGQLQTIPLGNAAPNRSSPNLLEAVNIVANAGSRSSSPKTTLIGNTMQSTPLNLSSMSLPVGGNLHFVPISVSSAAGTTSNVKVLMTQPIKMQQSGLSQSMVVKSVLMGGHSQPTTIRVIRPANLQEPINIQTLMKSSTESSTVPTAKKAERTLSEPTPAKESIVVQTESLFNKKLDGVEIVDTGSPLNNDELPFEADIIHDEKDLADVLAAEAKDEMIGNCTNFHFDLKTGAIKKEEKVLGSEVNATAGTSQTVVPVPSLNHVTSRRFLQVQVPLENSTDKRTYSFQTVTKNSRGHRHSYSSLSLSPNDPNGPIPDIHGEDEEIINSFSRSPSQSQQKVNQAEADAKHTSSGTDILPDHTYGAPNCNTTNLTNSDPGNRLKEELSIEIPSNDVDVGVVGVLSPSQNPPEEKRCTRSTRSNTRLSPDITAFVSDTPKASRPRADAATASASASASALVKNSPKQSPTGSLKVLSPTPSSLTITPSTSTRSSPVLHNQHQVNASNAAATINAVALGIIDKIQGSTNAQTQTLKNSRITKLTGGNKRKRQESDSSSASRDENMEEKSEIDLNSRPGKRKCSENAAEMIKVCIGVEDSPKRSSSSVKKSEEAKGKEGKKKQIAAVIDEEDDVDTDSLTSRRSGRSSRESSEDRSSSRGSSAQRMVAATVEKAKPKEEEPPPKETKPSRLNSRAGKDGPSKGKNQASAQAVSNMNQQSSTPTAKKARETTGKTPGRRPNRPTSKDKSPLTPAKTRTNVRKDLNAAQTQQDKSASSVTPAVANPDNENARRKTRSSAAGKRHAT